MTMRLIKLSAALFALAAALSSTFAQNEIVEIWKGVKMPGVATKMSEINSVDFERLSGGYRFVSNATVEFYPAKTENPVGAIVICPGGAYKILSYGKAGLHPAKFLSERGINCFVLKYRIPQNRDGAFQDAQRAIRIVRQNAEKWNLDPNKVGIMGFSAGGHLAARVSANSDEESYEPLDDADKFSAKPDFTVLVYPAYLSPKDSHELLPEIKVGADTPPAFISAAQDDVKNVRNAIGYYLSLKENNVPADLHMFAEGGHGYGIAENNNKPVCKWGELLAGWLKFNKYAE